MDYELGAEEQQRSHHHLVDELNALARDVAEVQDAKAGADIARELFFPAALDLGLDGHDL
jgi:hypothetical protein